MKTPYCRPHDTNNPSLAACRVIAIRAKLNTLTPAAPTLQKGPGGRGVRGMALIEALVASAVLGIGMAGATRLTLYALQTASDTRQHTVAHTLAVDAMECLQSGKTDCALSDSRTVQGTTYTVQSQQQPRTALALVDLQVRVQWPAMGRNTPSTSDAPNTAAASGSRVGELMLRSSRDEVPGWVGVSSP